jgi:hypothetical protein
MDVFRTISVLAIFPPFGSANMADLGTVRSREKLKPQREPHWHKLATGQFLGFRPSSTGKGGTWIARFYDPDTRRKPIKSLGDFGHLPASERFSAAANEAREWFRHLSHGGSEDDVTVREACERYASENPDAAKRFPRYVYDDPIARIKLQKLREHHVKEWRQRLEAMPALVSRSKSAQQQTTRAGNREPRHRPVPGGPERRASPR